MGAFLDGSMRKFTRDDSGNQVDIAKENRLRGVANHSWGAIAVQQLPSIFMCFAGKVGGGSSKSKDTTKDTTTEDTTKKNLQKDLQDHLDALGIKDARQINERVSEAISLYQPFALAVTDAKAELDAYKNKWGDLVEWERPGDYDSEISRLENEVQKTEKAEQNAKIELDKVLDNAKKAYECAQKLADLKDYASSDIILEEQKEKLRIVNEERANFLAATTDDAKKAAANKINDTIKELDKNDPQYNMILNTAYLLRQSYKIDDYITGTPAF